MLTDSGLYHSDASDEKKEFNFLRYANKKKATITVVAFLI